MKSPWVDILTDARRSARQVVVSEYTHPPADAAEGYHLAAEIAGQLESGAAPWEALGWKIAGTTEAVRTRLGISGPIYGRTWRQFVHQAPARLEHQTLLDPLIECEFFVTLGKALPSRAQPWTRAEVMAAVAGVTAGVEIAECRFPNLNLPVLPLVLADGAASGRYVVGEAIIDWTTRLSSMRVELVVDGQLKRMGKGADVMGDPLVPLVWLAETLRQRGRGLKAGEMISTGSCTGMLPARRGQRIEARYDSLAPIVIDFV